MQIKRFEKLETVDERRKAAKEIYDNFIMKELLSHTHVSQVSCFLFLLVKVMDDGRIDFLAEFHQGGGGSCTKAPFQE